MYETRVVEAYDGVGWRLITTDQNRTVGEWRALAHSGACVQVDGKSCRFRVPRFVEIHGPEE